MPHFLGTEVERLGAPSLTILVSKDAKGVRATVAAAQVGRT